MQHSRVIANGIGHHVRLWGDDDAPPVLFLHGFPDSGAVWSRLAPLIAAQGFRVIAPDMRGFGETDAPPRVCDYALETAIVPDMLALCEALALPRAHLVGHDFGAAAGWMLAAQAPERFLTWSALCVGHPEAYLAAGFAQKRRGAYVLVHLMRGVCEWLYRRRDWALLRRHWEGAREIDETIALLARPGRLTAGLNWYRANITLGMIAGLAKPPASPPVPLPTLGVWPVAERYLVEAQMTGSAAHVAAPFRYARLEGAGHWLQVDAPDALAALLVSHFRAHSPV